MPNWVSEWVPILQLLLNASALVGGAVIWKLYVDNLKAANAAKDATIESVEKSRDHWREKAEDLERRSPEVVEKILAERIQIRDGEINRLKEDSEFNKLALRELEMGKSELEQDLLRTQGFRAMLALEETYDTDDEGEAFPLSLEASALAQEESTKSIEVVYIGEVGVDSGQLMVTDPCYIDQEWQHEPFAVRRDLETGADPLFNYSYNGASNATLSGQGHGQLAYKMGHAGAGVAFRTGWGDGVYSVYAEKHDGRIVRIYVNVG